MPGGSSRKGSSDAPATLWMIIDPETREAYRLGKAPEESGPLLFTTRECLAEYAQQAGIQAYEVVEVPAYVLKRLRGKPHWLDGQARS